MKLLSFSLVGLTSVIPCCGNVDPMIHGVYVLDVFRGTPIRHIYLSVGEETFRRRGRMRHLLTLTGAAEFEVFFVIVCDLY